MTATNTSAADALRDKRDALVAHLVGLLQASHEVPAVRATGDPCVRDVGLHVDALADALAAAAPEDQFAEYCAWTSLLLDVIGAGSAELVMTLDALGPASIALHGAGNTALDITACASAARQRLAMTPRVTPAELEELMLTRPDPALSATGALSAAADAIAGLTTICTYMRRPDLAILHGERRSRCLRDADVHSRLLRESVTEDDPSIFANYAGWLASVLEGLGLDASELPSSLEALRTAVSIAIGPERCAAADAAIDAAQARLREGDCLPESFLDADAPNAALASAYLETLLAGDRRGASLLVVEKAKSGVSIAEIYSTVLQPVQYEVGRLWQANRISVAQEHFCTAATQMVMSQLYPYMFADDSSDRSLVATSVGGNHHEIGIRFVADLFEMAGWDTFYLGANTPGDAVVREVVERSADVLAISATLHEQVASVRDLIAAIRAEPAAKETTVIVGGHPFRQVASLWKDVGADAFARDATEAVDVVNAIFTPAGADSSQ